MSLTIKKDFYSLAEAAKSLKCTVNDLIHLSLNRTIKIYFYLNCQRLNFVFGITQDGEDITLLEARHIHIGLARVTDYTLREILKNGVVNEFNQEVKSYEVLHGVDISSLFHHYSKLKKLNKSDFGWYRIENAGNPQAMPWEIDNPFIATQDSLFVLDSDIQLLANGATSKEIDDIKPRERETMISIIHALAKNGYRYPKHGSIKEMLDDFQRNNNGVSETTLKKYLNEFDAL